jgi:hypothetical protein
VNGICSACGGSGEPCCGGGGGAGGDCGAGFVCGNNQQCASCGGMGQACCTGRKCNNALACTNGQCG